MSIGKREIKKEHLPIIVLVAFSILVQLAILPNFGSLDTNAFIRVVDTVEAFGLKQGYAIYNLVYPPLSSIFAYGIHLIIPLYSFMPKHLQVLAIKVGLAIFHYGFLACILLFHRKNKKLSWFAATKETIPILLNIALIESTFIIGSFDILLAIPLFFAFYFVYKKKFFWSGFFLATAFCTKLLPILLIPAFLVFFSSKLSKEKITLNWRAVNLFFLGMLVVVVPLVAYFGYPEIREIFVKSSVHSDKLSAAFNFNRIVRELFMPENITTPAIYYFGRGVFFLTSAFLLIRLWMSPKNIQNLLYTSIGIIITYFTFLAGVHQNHIFPALIFAILLVMYNKNSINMFIYYSITAIAFINWFAPYGFGYFETVEYTGIRYLWQLPVTTIGLIYALLSLLTVFFFGGYMWLVLRPKFFRQTEK
ncbi:MAG: glycosyltransferase family 87 protein [bacterium]|nr:glycosyltransferase family 87 protein [bacterium]